MNITLSEKAKERVLFYMKDKNPIDWGLRVRIKNGKSDFSLENLKMLPPIDETIECEGIKIVTDTSTKFQLEGAKIDFVEDLTMMGLQILIPKQVIRELKNMKSPNSDLALQIFEKHDFRLVDLEMKSVDRGLIEYSKKHGDIFIATLDKEIKEAVDNSKVIIREKKRLGIV